jgi:ribosomal protein S18 acetylase RimI-like enzyme
MVKTVHPLDDAVRASLTGPHARFAERRGNVLRYQPDVSPFLAFPAEPAEADWAAAAELAGPGGLVPLPGIGVMPPDGWEVVRRLAGVQMVAVDLVPEPAPDAVVLGLADVPQMLDLVGRTKPGPFLPRTIEMGTYLGIRHDGKLVAMAGERLHPPGWTEISAVCTDAGWQGRGLASRLVRAVAAGIAARGETPFLHAVITNDTAIRLYERLGFRFRATAEFGAARVPQALGCRPLSLVNKSEK